MEGKVDEPFGELVGRWRTAGKSPRSLENRATRLNGLCDLLGVDVHDPRLDRVRYQLLHRTYSALVTAKAANALPVLLVHSFDPQVTGLPDFERFVVLLGGKSVAPGAWTVKTTSGELHLLWCQDVRGTPSRGWS